jgi:hypothetical protein
VKGVIKELQKTEKKQMTKETEAAENLSNTASGRIVYMCVCAT